MFVQHKLRLLTISNNNKKLSLVLLQFIWSILLESHTVTENYSGTISVFQRGTWWCFFVFFLFFTSIQETAGYSQSQDRATHIILSCTLAHMHSHTHACTHPCMHTPMHACMCTCTHTHTHTRMHRCMHAPMRVHQKSDFTFLFLTSSVTPSWLLHFAQNSLFVAFCNFPCCFTEKNECASML